MALTSCPACGDQVSAAAKSCPHCGHPFDTMTPTGKAKIRWWLVLVVVAIGAAAMVYSLEQSREKSRRDGCRDAQEWMEGVGIEPTDDC